MDFLFGHTGCWGLRCWRCCYSFSEGKNKFQNWKLAPKGRVSTVSYFKVQIGTGSIGEKPTLNMFLYEMDSF
jgi:hypothetical protein